EVRAARLDEDHIVELEALHLLDLGHLDPRSEREVLPYDLARARHLAVDQALRVERADLARRREHRDRREPLALRELLERFGEERDARAVIGEAEELDRRTFADGAERRVVLAKGSEDVRGEARDLARAAVAHLEGVHFGAAKPELREERRPR